MHNFLTLPAHFDRAHFGRAHFGSIKQSPNITGHCTLSICTKDDSKQVKGLVLVVQSFNLELGTIQIDWLWTILPTWFDHVEDRFSCNFL